MENISEKVNKFLEGHNPMERVVCIECGFDDERVAIIYNREDGKKMIHFDDFKPFVWAKESACVKMFDGDRKELKKALTSYNIGVKKLSFESKDGETNSRLTNGYKYIFFAKKKMSFSEFQKFFQIAKTPIYPRKKKGETINSTDKEFLCVSPNEQYMISSGIRLFKGYNRYDELKRLLWDIETTGLNPEKDSIDQIGVRTNKGFEEVISVEGDNEYKKQKSEYNAVRRFLEIISNEKPDIIAGHNSEVFDFPFIMKRVEMYGESFQELSLDYFSHPVYKKDKETVLKLGGEVEYFKPTCMWGTTILDSLHAVRRAQASDSNIKSANLKYVTKYLDLQKQNRVYVPGEKIGTTWRENEKIYALNNENGDWYKITDEKPIQEGYDYVSGRYIVERYLLDDIWETDKVELALNEANFLIAKILPTSFQRASTMGTAGIWKLIMLAWSYENNLAIPSFEVSHSFTGGLSRLLKTGYVDNVAKFDFNSLYPSIMLTWWIKSGVDTTDSILNMLNYVLTNREYYKGLKADAGAKEKKLKKYLDENKDKLTKEEIQKLHIDIQNAKIEKNSNDKKQLPLKILGNSVFGSFGSPNIFNWGDQKSAEYVTCTGRMCLRLLISHLNGLGYLPIVGDSVTGDTPLFIKYKHNGYIDIKPIGEIFDDNKSETDVFGRNYDYSEKDYKVLCRSGWSDVQYVYKHKTEKDIYEVNDGKSSVECTQDHSLFDENKKEIKPTEITNETKLEYYNGNIVGDNVFICNRRDLRLAASMLKKGVHDRLHSNFLNMSNNFTEELLKFIGNDFVPSNKTCLAQIIYLNNKINKK